MTTKAWVFPILFSSILLSMTASLSMTACSDSGVGDDVYTYSCSADISEFNTSRRTLEAAISHEASLTFGAAGMFTCELEGGHLVIVVWSMSNNESPSPVQYFDAETGNLIAAWRYSDVDVYCDMTSATILYGSLPADPQRCDLEGHRAQAPVECYRSWDDQDSESSFEWTAEKCHFFEYLE